MVIAGDTFTAPWWGVAVIAGGFTFGGIVLTELFNLLTEGRRSSFLMTQQFELARQNLYARYLADAHALLLLASDSDAFSSKFSDLMLQHNSLLILAPQAVNAFRKR